ncbi:MAG TPA: hypothetical protein VLY23_08920 [Candidatus Acidoferrum sp.]|nr:hypothetical protein [Candidatus Acidoferrum sp.]
MNRKNNFDSVGRRFAVLIALATIGVLFGASGAKAGCGAPSKAGFATPVPFASHSANAPSKNQGEDDYHPASIVGLWHVAYTATYTTSGPLPVPVISPPESFPFVQTYKTWHGDGTEFENAFLPTPGGNICFGVWKDLDHGTVKLHHIGLMFTPDGSAIANIFTVDEIDTVAPNGKTYSGRFDMKIFDATDVLGKGTVLQEIKGTTTATRITVD